MVMSEIWNLSTLCRCCHADGHFKSLNLTYQGKKCVEIYENMLKDTLGITISSVYVKILESTYFVVNLEASYTICEECIDKLRDATDFKAQVQTCEQKFKEYCENEQFFSHPEVKVEDDLENSSCHSNDDDDDDNNSIIDHSTTNIKEELMIKIDKTENFEDLKEATVNQIIDEYIIKEKIGKKSKYSCKECGATFANIKIMNKHLSGHRNMVYKCENCPKVVKSHQMLLKHLEIHKNSDKDLQCSLCPRTFSKKEILDAHIQVHMSQKTQPICDMCKKIFTTKGTLIRHLRVHSGTNKSILCEICGWGFNDKTNLNNHINTVHRKLKPFECHICNKRFPTRRSHREHTNRHLRNKELYSCSSCDWKTHSEKKAQTHTLKHENKYMCRICPEIFDDPKSRKSHGYTKHCSKYKCTVCGACLANQYTLERHLECHKGVKRFSCSVCGEKFLQKATLIRHSLRKHKPDVLVDVGKTKCKICKRSYMNIGEHLKRHQIRNFACDICGQAYATKSTLNRHKQQKHFGRCFYCGICNKKYMQKSKMYTHMFKVHKVENKGKEIDQVENDVVKE
ncbi:hypothetical protein HW555_014178 [Spodoptera exigua]|uniref:C2H2-type domain-containing protein n=1 Tax=Spodoptera exigua TaxID=7107 RepID=A0A835G486_SPOEX|nr:hypothetical protein HW555_014178 [Spodoptera exigua]